MNPPILLLKSILGIGKVLSALFVFTLNVFPSLGNKDKIDVNYSLFDEGKYSSGDVVGYVSVSLNETVIRKENIYVKKVEIQKHISWWTKFLRWLGW